MRKHVALPAQGMTPLDRLLAEAAEKSASYDWAGAVGLYKKVSEKMNNESSPLEVSRVLELEARARFKSALQSGRIEEFEERMRLTEAAYEQARALYEKAGSDALAKKSQARSLFASFWLQKTPEQKIRMIKECISLADEATQLIGRQQESRLYAETLKDLLAYFFESLYLPLGWKLRKEFRERAFTVSEEAKEQFEELGDDENLLETLHMAICLQIEPHFTLLEPLSMEAASRIASLGKQLSKLSESLGTPSCLCLSNEACGRIASYFEGNDERALRLYEAGLAQAESTRDSYLVARLLQRIEGSCSHLGLEDDDPEKKRILLEKAIELGPRTVSILEDIGQVHLLDRVFSFYAEGFSWLAMDVEIEPKKRKDHLRRAIEIAGKGRTYEDFSAEATSAHALSKGLYFLASLEEDMVEKKRLLAQALSIRELEVEKLELQAADSYGRGLAYNYQALIKAELSSLANDAKTKVTLLQEAVSEMQQCVDICRMWVPTGRRLEPFLARFEESYGDILVRLQDLTSDPALSQKAIRSYQDSVDIYTKLGRTGPTAAIWWKIAKAHDAIADYKSASDAFRKAAASYRTTAITIPSLSSAFQELSQYMDGWTQIEDAKARHLDEQYQSAAEDYKRAAEMLLATKGWTHLSQHYEACFLLEKGEALSQQERHDEALESFRAATEAFDGARKILEKKPSQGHGFSDSGELQSWLEITDGRRRYSLARAILEEAKVLDMKGEEDLCRAKYASASEMFSQLHSEATSEQGRRELGTLTLYSAAWTKLKEAESRASPELYSEAASVFLEIEALMTGRRSRLVAMANESLCRALELGARFRRTREDELYGEIKKRLETAADSYREAGFEKAADWTRATQRMFDALAYLASAESQLDTKKKTELYHVAQNYLELSAKLYGEAGFPRKREETLRHLKRVQEEKRILLTPIEVLADNPATAVSVSPVSLTRDRPVGLERFEAANVAGNLTFHPRELRVGSNLTLELELTNIGKTASTLVKLENVAPEGLELDRERTHHRVEDSHIDLKGRRLEYLKTHGIRIVLSARRKGTFELRPRILYLDERGTYLSYEFEPAEVTVNELGVSGWLKGPK